MQRLATSKEKVLRSGGTSSTSTRITKVSPGTTVGRLLPLAPLSTRPKDRTPTALRARLTNYRPPPLEQSTRYALLRGNGDHALRPPSRLVAPGRRPGALSVTALAKEYEGINLSDGASTREGLTRKTKAAARALKCITVLALSPSILNLLTNAVGWVV